MKLGPNVECFFKMVEALNHVTCKCNEYCDAGSIVVASGVQQIVIKTTCEPNEVWLKVVSEDMPVCGGDIDMVGYQLLPDGFVLYAVIQSNTAEVFYAVK